MPWYRRARIWISIVTFALVAALVAGSWNHIIDAFHSLARVDVWVLLLLVPVQLLSYWVTGETMFSFLRSRGELRGMHPLTAMRMSLEFNFSNHMLPSAGAAGIVYTTWKLGRFGVSPERASVAQLARFAVTFISFSVLLTAATVSLVLAGEGSPQVLGAAALVGALALVSTTVGVVLLRRRRLLHRTAGLVTALANRVLRLLRRPNPLSSVPVVRYFDGLYLEVRALGERPATLLRPFLWSAVTNLADASLFFIALSAFGVVPDPRLVFVAYGLATLASIVIVTPNGLGAYEVALIAVLVSGGLAEGTTIAAVVLARVVLLLGTIVFGWGFYQQSVLRSGAPPIRVRHLDSRS
ncbi:lysylphosphatidylglycerol synthase transmembrane domain-containing protein [Plantibacter sp. YIM 135347]|uniref:lysylphosphatidylglycerol synthase transmembrane domain-containing protein n=1 Tax=Plantibacter sp. YIM 135347 TaxID=3423919 RepID=UPI003D352262